MFNTFIFLFLYIQSYHFQIYPGFLFTIYVQGYTSIKYPRFVLIWDHVILLCKGKVRASALSRHTQSASPVSIPSRQTQSTYKYLEYLPCFAAYLERYPHKVGTPRRHTLFYIRCGILGVQPIQRHTPYMEY